MPRQSQSLYQAESIISRQHRVWLYFWNSALGHQDFDQQLERITALPITGLILPKALARHVQDLAIPLIIHLNSQTQSPLTEQVVAPVNCTVAEAKDMQAKALLYTMYLGSAHQEATLLELKRIKKQAHAHRLPLIVTTVMAGVSLDVYRQSNLLAYAATVSKNWSVDYICLPSSSDHQHAKIAQILDRTHLLVDISSAKTGADLIEQTKQTMISGSAGIITDQTVLEQLSPEIIRKTSQAIFGLT